PGRSTRQRFRDHFFVAHATIPWLGIIGMRNRLNDGHVGVDVDRVLDTIAGDPLDEVAMLGTGGQGIPRLAFPPISGTRAPMAGARAKAPRREASGGRGPRRGATTPQDTALVRRVRDRVLQSRLPDRIARLHPQHCWGPRIDHPRGNLRITFRDEDAPEMPGEP